MAFYDGLFNALGLRDWCDGDGAGGGVLTMEQLMAKAQGADADAAGPWFPFPSLDNLHMACESFHVPAK